MSLFRVNMGIDSSATNSNFDFLRQEFPAIAETASQMENLVLTDARASCFYARRTIELLVKWLYDHDNSLKWPYSNKLGALLAEPSLTRVVAPEIRAKLSYIQTIGNRAVH